MYWSIGIWFSSSRVAVAKLEMLLDDLSEQRRGLYGHGFSGLGDGTGAGRL